MRKFLSFLNFVASLALVVVFFFSSVQVVALNQNFFSREYRKLDTARHINTTHSELMNSTEDLLDYIRGKDVDLSETRVKINGENRRAFSADEVQHMSDIRVLYHGFSMFRIFALIGIAIVVLLNVLLLRKDRLLYMARAYSKAAIGVCVLILVLVIWMAIDFNSFWRAFHTVFFRNDLWILPADSFMIQMLDAQLWTDVCARVAIFFISSVGGLLAACLIYLGVKRHRRHTLLTIGIDPPSDDWQNESYNDSVHNNLSYDGVMYDDGPYEDDDAESVPDGPNAPWHGTIWEDRLYDEPPQSEDVPARPPESPWNSR